MQMLLIGFIFGFALALLLLDDLAERKLKNYILERRIKMDLDDDELKATRRMNGADKIKNDNENKEKKEND